MLRSDRVWAELLRRDPHGGWPEQPFAVPSGSLMLESVGFQLDLSELYERTGLGG